MVGCGNSKLTEQMFDDGYKGIVSIDISEVIVDKMRNEMLKKNKNIPFLVMDATKMTYEDNSFDVVIDKGTLDALACG